MKPVSDKSQSEKKRKVPPILAKLLDYDISLTKTFLRYADNFTVFRSLKNHAKALEISCHGIAWLCVWMLFIFAFNKPYLYELQVNMLLALLLDITIVCLTKAFVRRRRPIANTDMFTVGPDKFSFPSGHASRATMIAYFFIHLYPISFIFYGPLIAWTVSICLSRVLSRRHYILDVVAGVQCGLVHGFVMNIIWFNQTFSAGFLSLFSESSVED